MATTITREIRDSASWSIVLSVLMVISGVLAIIVPPVGGLAATLMFGRLLLFTGGLHVGYAWRGHGAAAVIGEIVVALLYASLGVYLLARPVAGLGSLTLVIATYFIAKGVLEGVIAFKSRGPLHARWCRAATVRRRSHDVQPTHRRDE